MRFPVTIVSRENDTVQKYKQNFHSGRGGVEFAFWAFRKRAEIFKYTHEVIFINSTSLIKF